MYAEETKTALIEAATALFAELGYAGTSLEAVAARAMVTRGAVYHHFAGKRGLFEEVLDRLGADVMDRVAKAAATQSDPWESAMVGLDAFLEESSDPIYAKLVWHEGPSALGWDGWRRCEQNHSYVLVERAVADLTDSGYFERRHQPTLARVVYEMLAGAGLTLANATPETKSQVREDCSKIVRSALAGISRDAIDQRIEI